MAVAVGLALAGCGGGDDRREAAAPATTARPSAPCQPVVEEPLDPDLTHLLAGAPEPSYATDPPTSGPHVVGPVPTGVLTEPLRGSQQVALLERGHVLVQYRDLSAVDVEALEGLVGTGGDRVTVAPNPGLPGRVVATGWTVKQVCRAVDLPTLERFVADHVGRGPGEG